MEHQAKTTASDSVPVDTLFELWIDRCEPGRTAQAVDAVANAATTGCSRALEAAWTTEFGEVDEVLSLWRCQSPAGHEPPAPARDLPFSRSVTPLVLQQPFTRDFAGGHLYDFRRYTLHPDTGDEFLRYMAAALPVRRRYSRNVGVWRPAGAQRDEVVHVWAYRNLEERQRVRNQVAAEPAWQQYLEKIFPLTQRMRNALLVPAACSPMQ